MARSYYALILAIFVAVVSCYSEIQYKTTFTEWMHRNGKTYTASEFQKRYNTFKSNMDFVKSWNEDSSHTHTVALNQFADLTNEEFARIYLMTPFDASERLRNAPITPVALDNQPGNVQGDIVNWVNQGAVTGVKNQGQCGSCWSFSTTGSIEGINFINTQQLTSLSEQNLMDCSSANGNQGCNGGLPDNAFQYVISNGGIDTEDSYPYTGVVGSCNYQASNSGANISAYTDVTSGDENALANAVNNQPVSVAIDASENAFQLYSSGIYNNSACSSTNLDHAVLVVGYGTSPAGDYWLVKNSWGTSWGEAGYIQMARNDNNMCGIATQASFPTQ